MGCRMLTEETHQVMHLYYDSDAYQHGTICNQQSVCRTADFNLLISLRRCEIACIS